MSEAPALVSVANAAPPTLWVLGFLLVVLLTVLVTGRVPVARTFTRVYLASRRDTPALYWFFVLVQSCVTAMVAWWAALAMDLDDRLPPGARAIVEGTAPYAAAALLAAFAVLAYAAGRRRRARLRSRHPSAVERAAGGV